MTEDSDKRRALWDELRSMERASQAAHASMIERITRVETRQETLTRLCWGILAALILSKAHAIWFGG